MCSEISIPYFCNVHYLSIKYVDLDPKNKSTQFYLKTGQCKYGATCKFNHPKDIQIPSTTQENKSAETETALKTESSEVAVKPLVSFTPALLYNSKELPVRPVCTSTDD